MTDTSTTIRERVAEAIRNATFRVRQADGSIEDECLAAADAAIAIVVEAFRNGQGSLLDEEAKKDG